MFSLDTSGVDGAKNFAITLKDAALNQSGAVNVSIDKSVVAPSSVTLSEVVDTQLTGYPNLTITGDKSFTGATLTITSRNG